MRERQQTIGIAADAAPPTCFAAEELARYLGTMSGAAIAVERAPVPRHSLTWATTDVPDAAPAGDGFVVRPVADGAVIRGGSGRAVLYGVYALLEQLGCEWSLHRRGEEVVPRWETRSPLREQRWTPRFDVRGYSADIMTWHYGDAAGFAEHLAADHEFIDWMGKSRANARLFIRHPFDSQLTIPELLPEFARRGVDLEYGGHVIPLLVPRELFAEHPEYFPETMSGARSEFGNLCTSSLAALRVATENAVRYVRDYPELRVLHIWGADLWDGGWCRCPECRSVSVQDQQLRLCNAVAAELAAQGVARPVCYLAYHDTLDATLTERPLANVFVEYAPRERCYGHSIGDPGCHTNRRYREALERYAELFDGRVRIFEYYADAILFCGCAVPLGEVIAADLDYYHRLGIRQITNLEFGGFSLWAYPLNFLVYAQAANQAASDTGCDVAAIRKGYATRFGREASVVADALGELERAMATVVRYGDIRRPPGDDKALKALAARVEQAVDDLARLSDRLPPASVGSEYAALCELLRYNLAMLRGLKHEIAGQYSEAHYDAAQAIVRAVDRRFTGLWGQSGLPMIHAYHARPEPKA